jgi:hypothetical protein
MATAISQVSNPFKPETGHTYVGGLYQPMAAADE